MMAALKILIFKSAKKSLALLQIFETKINLYKTHKMYSKIVENAVEKFHIGLIKFWMFFHVWTIIFVI